MSIAREGANSEDKSSAGDKHETGRAMAQLETEKTAKQLQDALDDLAVLKRLDPEKETLVAVPGSVVSTDKGNFYLATAIGRIQIGETEVIVLSPASPLGTKMLGLVEGKEFEMNGRGYLIKEVL
ncbi:MAG: 3-oxoacyl-ACP synthase, partial [Bacteroidota bacterium]